MIIIGWMESLCDSLISALMTWTVVNNVSLSEDKDPIEVQFTLVPFRSAATLATDIVDINRSDPVEEFLVILNSIPLIRSIEVGDTFETSLVLESVSGPSMVTFHSMKIRLVLHVKCRFSPGQMDIISGVESITLDLDSAA